MRRETLRKATSRSELEHLESIGVSTTSRRRYVVVSARNENGETVAESVCWDCSISQALERFNAMSASDDAIPAMVTECGEEVVEGQELTLLDMFMLPVYEAF